MSAPKQPQQSLGDQGGLYGQAQSGSLQGTGSSGMVSGATENLTWASATSSGQVARPPVVTDLVRGWTSPGAYAPARIRPSRWAIALELATSFTGLALFAFMLMHLTLLSSVLLGVGAMNALASFLEENYLLQIGAVLLVPTLAAHIALTARKVPLTFRQQRGLLRQMSWLRHPDTWTWAFQVITGAAILVLAAVHLWVVLTDLPIQAAKSGARVFASYLWFYIPFVILVEFHASIGLYRIAVKWGPLSRHRTHLGLTVWSVIAVALGFVILATFYLIGRSL